ncbi:hypothetical protein GZL_01715 [Streptomyces sp. 769]|nr:hypothetical protein GZL_01715 [Streptomyces sp. 769]
MLKMLGHWHSITAFRCAISGPTVQPGGMACGDAVHPPPHGGSVHPVRTRLLTVTGRSLTVASAPGALGKPLPLSR